jgi:hypothetical protein
MAETVYILCTLTCLICALLLLRAWRSSRSKLLFWSGLCFVALTVNNALLFLDLVVLPGMDLRLVRNGTALLGLGLMLYGLIAESR